MPPSLHIESGKIGNTTVNLVLGDFFEVDGEAYIFLRYKEEMPFISGYGMGSVVSYLATKGFIMRNYDSLNEYRSKCQAVKWLCDFGNIAVTSLETEEDVLYKGDTPFFDANALYGNVLFSLYSTLLETARRGIKKVALPMLRIKGPIFEEIKGKGSAAALARAITRYDELNPDSRLEISIVVDGNPDDLSRPSFVHLREHFFKSGGLNVLINPADYREKLQHWAKNAGVPDRPIGKRHCKNQLRRHPR